MKHLIRTVITAAAAGGLLFGGVAVAQDMTEPTELPYDTPEECEANGGTFALFMGCRDAEEYAAFLESLDGQPGAEPAPEGPAPAQPEPATQAQPQYTG